MWCIPHAEQLFWARRQRKLLEEPTAFVARSVTEPEDSLKNTPTGSIADFGDDATDAAELHQYQKSSLVECAPALDNIVLPLSHSDHESILRPVTAEDVSKACGRGRPRTLQDEKATRFRERLRDVERDLCSNAEVIKEFGLSRASFYREKKIAATINRPTGHGV